MSRLIRSRSWITIALLSLLAAAVSLFGNGASQTASKLQAFDAPVATVDVIESPPSAFDACDDERKLDLAEAFVAAYNASDVDAVLNLWDTSLPFDYIDNVGGVAYQPSDEAALREYLTGRFAANDRIELTGVELGTLPRNGAFNISFLRVSNAGIYEGNAKMVCEFAGGKLRTMIASSRLLVYPEPAWEATVSSYPAGCRAGDTRSSICATAPFVLVRNTEMTPLAGCEVDTVVEIVTGFLAALNSGDLEATLAYFPARAQETDIDSTGLQWVSIQETVAYTPDELRTLIADLQSNGAHLRLLRLDVTWSSWRDTAEMGVEMIGTNNDRPRIKLAGKAGINCELGQFFVLTAGAVE